ncbi:hypothetical protein, partial [Nocardia sp. NPDC004711]
PTGEFAAGGCGDGEKDRKPNSSGNLNYPCATPQKSRRPQARKTLTILPSTCPMSDDPVASWLEDPVVATG